MSLAYFFKQKKTQMFMTPILAKKFLFECEHKF